MEGSLDQKLGDLALGLSPQLICQNPGSISWEDSTGWL